VAAQQSSVIDPKSVMIPRYADLAAIQAAIPSPQTGMMVYNIGTQTNWTYNGTAWINSAGAGASQWNTSGGNIYYNNSVLNSTSINGSNNTTYSIPDNNPTGITSTINIPSTGIITNINNVTISINLNHTWAGDIIATLISPQGMQVDLIKRLGATSTITAGWNADFNSNNTLNFNQLASGQIQNMNPIPSGTYLPSAGSIYSLGSLAILSTISIAGDWKLVISDLNAGDYGNLISWSINFGANSVNYGGNVGIGIIPVNALLQFNNSLINRKIVLYDDFNNDNQFFGMGINSYTFRFQVSQSNDNYKFYAGSGPSSSALLFTIYGTGNATLSGSLTQASDIRLKKNIHRLNNSLSNLVGLNGYHYHWISKDKSQSLQTGLIAQEVQKLFPELIETDDKGFLSVNYLGLVPHLIEAIKEQQVQIESLKKASDSSLLSRIEKLEAMLNDKEKSKLQVSDK
jgi:subtilisin-like proprotein convertase family protein